MADDNLFAVALVTPERILVSGLATEVVLRTGEGDSTYLAGHTPLVGTVEPGVVRVVRAEGEETRVAVHGGFVQVEHRRDSGSDVKQATTSVTVLVGVAELAEEIDADRARAALEAAEARITELGGSPGRSAGSGGHGGSGQGAGGQGEDDTLDPELADADAAALRARVRLEAVDATTGAGAPA